MSIVAAESSLSENELRVWGATIQDGSAPLVERAQAMWALRHSNNRLAIQLLADYVETVSSPAAGGNALLQHEAAYCLGQTGHQIALDALERVIRNEQHEAVVRHEAGEGLAALANNPALDRQRIKGILADFSKSSITVLKETCEIGLHRLEWLSVGAEDKTASLVETAFPYNVDPSPSFSSTDRKSIAELRDLLIAPSSTSTLFSRYQALFSLRNASLEHPISDERMAEIIDALSASLAAPGSALLRHEVAFVLGQLNLAKTGQSLLQCLQSTKEHPIVRHEAAVSLGDVVAAAEAAAGDSVKISALEVSPDFIAAAKKALTEGLKDGEPLVRDSCALALDMAKHSVPDGRFHHVSGPTIKI